jgi:hypothetical protein
MKRIIAALLASVLAVTTFVQATSADALTVVFQHTGGGFGTNTWLYTSPTEETQDATYDASIVLNCDETNTYAHRWVVLDIKSVTWGPNVVLEWTVHSDASRTWQVPSNTLDVRFTVNSEGCVWTVRLFKP